MRVRRAYRRLRASGVRSVARAWFWLLWMDLVLRVMPFQQVLDRAAGPAARPAPSPADLRRARSYASVIELAAHHHLVRARCLHRSLVLAGWLRRDGQPGDLRIGVRRQADGIAAHAWVELEGTVVNDYPDAIASFVPLGRSQASPVGVVVDRGRHLQWL